MKVYEQENKEKQMTQILCKLTTEEQTEWKYLKLEIWVLFYQTAIFRLGTVWHMQNLIAIYFLKQGFM